MDFQGIATFVGMLTARHSTLDGLVVSVYSESMAAQISFSIITLKLLVTCLTSQRGGSKTDLY